MGGVHIKKEDTELYRFYFSKENMNMGKVSIQTKRILDYRYEEKMAVSTIAERMGVPLVKIRSEIRLFRRKALIAKWYTEKVRKMNETNDDVS